MKIRLRYKTEQKEEKQYIRATMRVHGVMAGSLGTPEFRRLCEEEPVSGRFHNSATVIVTIN